MFVYYGSTKRKQCTHEGLLSLTAQRAACETWNAHPSYWESVPLGPNFGIWTPFGGITDVTHDLGWWLDEEKPTVDFLFVVIGLFSLSITVPELWGEMCTAQILLGQGRPPFLGIRRVEALSYPMVKIAFLCVPSFWHNTNVWRTDGGTDRRTDRRICRSM